jgi:hypothetical protein
MGIRNSNHKTKQSETKLAQDFDMARVRDSSSGDGQKIPQLMEGRGSNLRQIDSPTAAQVKNLCESVRLRFHF